MTTAFTKRAGIAVAVLASGFVALVLGWFVLSSALGHRESKQRLTVFTSSPGLTALEVEREVTVPIELAMARVPGVTSVRSESRDGESRVMVGFDGDDFTFATSARTELSKALPMLPSGTLPETRVSAVEPVEERYLVRSDTLDALALAGWVKNELVRGIEVQSGVRQVEVCGGVEKTRVVTLDPQKLRTYGISLSDAMRAMELADEKDEVTLGSVSLRDVARIELTGVPDDCRAWLDGAPVIVVTVTRFIEGETKVPVPPASVSMKRLEDAIEGVYRAVDQPPSRGLVLKRGNEVISFAPQPGLEVLRKPDGVVVRVFGDDLAALRALAGSLHATIKDARWLGAVTPGDDVPTRTVKADRRKSEVAQTMRFHLMGTRARWGTLVKVEGGLDDAKLDDGEPLSQFITVTETVGPEAVLRDGHKRVVEFSVGASERDVKRAIEGVTLPAGVVVSVTQR